MTRALLGCTIVLTLALTAHAQGFDPLYKPKPGDEAMVGRPTGYNDHSTRIGMGFDQPKLSFFGDIGIEFPEMVTDVNRVTGHMEDGHTYLIKQGKRYRLHAGLKVKIIAKTRTQATLFNAQLVQEPVYEAEIAGDLPGISANAGENGPRPVRRPTNPGMLAPKNGRAIAEGEFAGTHLYIRGLSLQQKAKHLQDDWDLSAEAIHIGLVFEDDNPKFAIAEYQYAYSVSTNTKILAAAKSKLAEAGVPLPKTMAEFMAKLGPMEETKDKDDAEPKTSGFGKPLATPKEDAPEALTVDLLDTTWEHSSSGSHIYIYVKVRNTSGTTLNKLKVTASLEQQNNSIVSTEYSYLEPTVIEPSGVALAKFMIPANSLIHHYNLTFETRGREVKFKNRTR